MIFHKIRGLVVGACYLCGAVGKENWSGTVGSTRDEYLYPMRGGVADNNSRTLAGSARRVHDERVSLRGWVSRWVGLAPVRRTGVGSARTVSQIRGGGAAGGILGAWEFRGPLAGCVKSPILWEG